MLLAAMAALAAPLATADAERFTRNVFTITYISTKTQLVRAIEAVLVPLDSGRDGVLTVADDDFYVQCLSSRYLHGWRCEAAGSAAQPWLGQVLTPKRQARLAALGFHPDAATGNFVSNPPRTTPPKVLAGNILTALTKVYGADDSDVTIAAEWIDAAPCHPRMRAGVDGGGSIPTPRWGRVADADPGCGGGRAPNSFVR